MRPVPDKRPCWARSGPAGRLLGLSGAAVGKGGSPHGDKVDKGSRGHSHPQGQASLDLPPDEWPAPTRRGQLCEGQSVVTRALMQWVTQGHLHGALCRLHPGSGETEPAPLPGAPTVLPRSRSPARTRASSRGLQKLLGSHSSAGAQPGPVSGDGRLENTFLFFSSGGASAHLGTAPPAMPCPGVLPVPAPCPRLTRLPLPLLPLPPLQSQNRVDWGWTLASECCPPRVLGTGSPREKTSAEGHKLHPGSSAGPGRCLGPRTHRRMGGDHQGARGLAGSSGLCPPCSGPGGSRGQGLEASPGAAHDPEPGQPVCVRLPWSGLWKVLVSLEPCAWGRHPMGPGGLSSCGSYLPPPSPRGPRCWMGPPPSPSPLWTWAQPGFPWGACTPG